MKLFSVLNIFILSFLTAKALGAAIEAPESPTQAKVVQKVRPFIRRTFRSVYSPPPIPVLPTSGSLLDAIQIPGLDFDVTNVNNRFRTPRNYLIPFRKYRRISRGNLERGARTDNDSLPPNSVETSPRDLRFLGWLFGRPNYYSRYPNYSVLEEAAGIGPFSSRYPSIVHPESSVMVEDCTEMLDPYSHDIIEDCHEVPSVYH